MKIDRVQWVAVRRADDAVYSGRQDLYDFRTQDELGNLPIKYYQTAYQAVSRAAAATGLRPGEVVARMARETVEIM